MVAYADTSFLVAAYSPEADSQKALAWFQHANVPLLFTPLHRQELRNAIRLRVFRQQITREQRSVAFEDIQSDLDDGILVHTALPWTDALREADVIGAGNTERLGTRSADVLHVAVATVLQSTDFLTFDVRQGKLAKAAGLKVWPSITP
jgi:predicted nucleic acid-binding protein